MDALDRPRHQRPPGADAADERHHEVHQAAGDGGRARQNRLERGSDVDVRNPRARLYFAVCHSATSVLGAILLTGYLGGATATHVRVGDYWIGPVMFGVLVWLGLFLRDPRLRAILPLRSI